MADRGAEYITLDEAMPTQALNDLYAAEATLPRQIEKRQHALVHGWGGPPISRVIYMSEGGLGGIEQEFLLRVPPYCQFMRFAILGYNSGAVRLITAVDTDGAWLSWNNTSYEGAEWVYGSSVIELNYTDPVTMASVLIYDRAVKISTNSEPFWQTISINLTAAGEDGLRGIMFYPMLNLA